jgi:hypothetical protein
MSAQIHYLKHAELDMQQWDACVQQSVNRLPYAMSWYLDAATDQSWDALVLGAYQAVLPVPVKGQLFFKKAYQPFFLQQLGLFYKDIADAQLLPAMLDELFARHKRIQLHLNTDNLPPEKYIIKKRVTHHLNLNPSYDELIKQYSTQIKRNLKNARQHHLSIVHNVQPDDLLHMRRNFLSHVIKQGNQKEADTLRLGRIMQAAIDHQQGKIVGVQDAAGKLCAGIFLLSNDRCMIYLSAVSTDLGKDQHAMTFLLDDIFHQHANANIFFDFEGSMQPGLARYYKGFGGVEHWFSVIGRK